MKTLQEGKKVDSNYSKTCKAIKNVTVITNFKNDIPI